MVNCLHRRVLMSKAMTEALEGWLRFGEEMLEELGAEEFERLTKQAIQIADQLDAEAEEKKGGAA
jgi:hypothetical protein